MDTTYLEDYVDLLIKRTDYIEKDEAFNMSLERKIDFLAGNIVRHERKTHQLEKAVISMEEWECLYDRIG